MRNFSIMTILLVFWTILFPQVILASENNTKTKIEFKTKVGQNIFAVAPFNFEDIKPVESKVSEVETEVVKVEEVAKVEEVKSDRDIVLDKWKIKQQDRWNNLPSGKFTINASAYTAAADECGKSDGITASGLKVQKERTLACPPEYPFGAKLEIEGMGVYVCEDRGGAIKGNKFDIYMETKSEAFAFGRRNLTAQFVK